MAENETVKWKEGDTYMRVASVTDPATGLLRSLADFKLYWTFKLSQDDGDPGVLQKKCLNGVESGITLRAKVDPKSEQTVQSGEAVCVLTSTDMQTYFPYGTKVFWDFQAISPEGYVATQHDGTFETAKRETTKTNS